MADELYNLFFDYSEVQLLRYNEPDLGYFIAESPKVIERALNAGYVPVSLLIIEEQLSQEGKSLLEKMKDIPQYLVSYEDFKRGREMNITNGMLCAMKRKTMPSIAEICRGKRRIAVLDNVTNPTNVGAIIRAAAALGMEGCIITSDSSDPLYRRSARVSMGNVFVIPWTYGNPETYIDELKACSFKTAGMALKEDSFLVNNSILKKEEKLAIILGNEGWGLRDKTLEKCDFTVLIPMNDGVDSLNVSQASAVAFWEIGR